MNTMVIARLRAPASPANSMIARLRAPVGASIRPHVPPAARRARRRRLVCELVVLAVVVLSVWGLA